MTERASVISFAEKKLSSGNSNVTTQVQQDGQQKYQSSEVSPSPLVTLKQSVLQ